MRITPIDLDESDAPMLDDPGARASVHALPPGDGEPARLALKSMVYSDKRNLYPMKRVDFDPNGERNPQNRGISGYVRISWDEALDIVASEIKRQKTPARPGAIAVPLPRIINGATSAITFHR